MLTLISPSFPLTCRSANSARTKKRLLSSLNAPPIPQQNRTGMSKSARTCGQCLFCACVGVRESTERERETTPLQPNPRHTHTALTGTPAAQLLHVYSLPLAAPSRCSPRPLCLLTMLRKSRMEQGLLVQFVLAALLFCRWVLTLPRLCTVLPVGWWVTAVWQAWRPAAHRKSSRRSSFLAWFAWWAWRGAACAHTSSGHPACTSLPLAPLPRLFATASPSGPGFSLVAWCLDAKKRECSARDSEKEEAEREEERKKGRRMLREKGVWRRLFAL